MFKFLRLGVLRGGIQTKRYPQEPAELRGETLGLPVVDMSRCDRCGRCAAACPVQAIGVTQDGVCLSTERCIFCAACAEACPVAISMSKDFELSAKGRAELRVVYRHG